MPSYKLIYFNLRGRAEPARLCFAAAGIPYEDVRVDKEEWAKMKAENKTILGQLPVLEVDGVQYAESLAIFRLVARLGGFCPTCNFEIARCDMVVDVTADMFLKARPIYLETDPEKKQALQEEFKTKHLPHFLETMEKLLTAKCNIDGKAQFLIGNKMTYADIILFYAFGQLSDKFPIPALLDNHPALQSLYERVGENPGIKEWMEKRPKTDM